MSTRGREAIGATRRKVSVSYIFPRPCSDRHILGVGAMQYDRKSKRLFTGSRDSTVQCWNQEGEKTSSLFSLEGHTDWVNSLVLCKNRKTLFSASSDASIKIWDLDSRTCVSSLCLHMDYVKALAYAADKEIVVSAGFDGQILLLDANHITSSESTLVNTVPLSGHKGSIYSVAVNSTATLIVSGSSEKYVRLWDPRSNSKALKLRGHSDTVKCILINSDGTQCLSGSSDGTVRLWSIGQQRPISVYQMHTDGVWALSADKQLTAFYSSGRDRRVFYTDIMKGYSFFLLEEENPVLALNSIVEERGLWVGTTSSSLHFWNLKDTLSQQVADLDEDGADTEMVPLVKEPSLVIKGGPAIKQFNVLNDKRHILSRDSEDQVVVWDVVKVRPSEHLGHVDYKEELQRRQQYITYVPNWFQIDARIGVFTVTLEDSECFSAWIATTNIDNANPTMWYDVNYGLLVLETLFRGWKQTASPSTTGLQLVVKESLPSTPDLRAGQHHLLLSAFEVAHNTSEEAFFTYEKDLGIVFCEVGGCGRSLLRSSPADIVEPKDQYLREVMPFWLKEALLKKSFPKMNQIYFSLSSPGTMSGKLRGKDRLFAYDFILIQRVLEYIAESLSPSDSASSSSQANMEPDNMSSSSATSKSTDIKIDLFCQDQLLSPRYDLRTVRHSFCRGGGDLVFKYKVSK